MNEELWVIAKNGQRHRAEKIFCPTCNQKVLKAIYLIKRNKKRGRKNYCSLSCASKSCVRKRNAVTIRCFSCGKEKELWPSQIKKSKSGLNFCSQKCVGIAFSEEGKLCKRTTGKGDYKKRASKHYGEICEVCIKEGIKHQLWEQILASLQVHHIDKDRENNELENLIVLCTTHHSCITHGYAMMGSDRKFILDKQYLSVIH